MRSELGVFSRNEPAPARRIPWGHPGRLGIGRRLWLEAPLGQVATALASIMEYYMPRQYPELPRMVPAGWAWLGSDADRPDVVNCGVNHVHDPVFITFKGIPGGTLCGFFDPLRKGDGGVFSPLVRDLEGRMQLRSVEPYPADTLVMAPPPIFHGIIDNILTTAGRSLTEATARLPRICTGQ